MDSNIPQIAIQGPDDSESERVPNDPVLPSIEGRIHRDTWKNPILPNIASLPTRLEGTARAVETLFRDNCVPHLDNPGNTLLGFWPPKLFDHILSKVIVRRLVAELLQKRQLNVDVSTIADRGKNAETYWTDVICGANNQPEYRRVLASLLLAEKEDRINSFIDKELCDRKLPIGEDTLRVLGWTSAEREYFLMHPPRFMVDFLAPKSNTIPHYDIGEGRIKPWAQSPTRRKQDVTVGGGYGEVHEIVVHPWQHGFQEVLENLSAHKDTFALKRLYTSNEAAFKKETDMLKRFGGHRPNIVTLLATLTYNEQYHLLFPWAEGDMLTYWERKEKPPRDLPTYKWIFSQLHGIIDAVNYIHNPNLRNDDGEPIYGRHGDIKPENVLWFQRDSQGILVLSDLGLAAEHRETSRSNIPGEEIPRTPNYRPPECDMEGSKGFISRSYDIWTLGCLLMEFIVWILRGCEGRDEFNRDRFSPYINNIRTNIFFDIERKGDGTGQYVFKVKKNVEKWFADLHDDSNCSQCIHDLLDLVQDEMLLVSPGKRIRANGLFQRSTRLKERCASDSSYCLKPCPRKTTHDPQPPAEAELNANARQLIHFHGVAVGLQVFHGKTEPVKFH